MENSFENMEELISKYLAGEAGGDEIAILKAWRKQSPDNERQFIESKKLFEAMAGAGLESDVDVDAGWTKLELRIDGDEGAKVMPLKRRFSFMQVAASIVLLATLGLVVKFILMDKGSAPVIIMAGTNASEQKLPDGSKVFMNKHSEISYVAGKDQRGVKLKGEAYFDVVHNDAQPFVVEVDGIFIKDIGTAFNVKALPGGETVEVLVESGEVQFYSDASNSINLVKGEKAVYNKQSHQFTKQSVAATDNSVSYKSKVFHFNNASLKEVVEQVNEVYGSNIQLSCDGLGDCRLSVEFNNEDLQVLVTIIAETLDLTIEQKGSAITLKGEPCP